MAPFEKWKKESKSKLLRRIKTAKRSVWVGAVRPIRSGSAAVMSSNASYIKARSKSRRGVPFLSTKAESQTLTVVTVGVRGSERRSRVECVLVHFHLGRSPRRRGQNQNHRWAFNSRLCSSFLLSFLLPDRSALFDSLFFFFARASGTERYRRASIASSHLSRGVLHADVLLIRLSFR